MFYINEVVYVKILSKNTDGINFLSGLRDQNFGKMGLRDQNNGKKIGINGSRIYHVTTLQLVFLVILISPAAREKRIEGGCSQER